MSTPNIGQADSLSVGTIRQARPAAEARPATSTPPPLVRDELILSQSWKGLAKTAEPSDAQLVESTTRKLTQYGTMDKFRLAALALGRQELEPSAIADALGELADNLDEHHDRLNELPGWGLAFTSLGGARSLAGQLRQRRADLLTALEADDLVRAAELAMETADWLAAKSRELAGYAELIAEPLSQLRELVSDLFTQLATLFEAASATRRLALMREQRQFEQRWLERMAYIEALSKIPVGAELVSDLGLTVRGALPEAAPDQERR